jgi:hypothetical protein
MNMLKNLLIKWGLGITKYGLAHEGFMHHFSVDALS